MANKSPWQKAFIQGYACAVANIIRTHGEDGIAWDVFVAQPREPEMTKRRIKICWSCLRHHEHRWYWTAWLCIALRRRVEQ